MNIAGIEVGPSQPCRVVAEIGTNHNGSLTLAKRLIRECADAGADLIKFQAYTFDEMVALRGDGPIPEPWASLLPREATLGDLYMIAQTPHEWFPQLIGECIRNHIPWFSSVFGLDSLAYLESLGCLAYKVAAPDTGSDELLDAVIATGKPIVASARMDRLDWADLTLYCPEGYPQHWGDPEVYYSHFDGISYHGTDPSVLRFVRDCGFPVHMIECHVQLDDVPSELDAHSSLTVSQLAELCAR